MRIDWVIPCRYVEIHDNLGSLMGAGVDTFWLSELPGQVQVAMAIRMSATTEELESSAGHAARSVVRDPQGEVVLDESVEFEVDAEQPLVQRAWLKDIMVSTLLAFVAETEGTYSFEHIVDGSSVTVPLHVVEGDPDED